MCPDTEKTDRRDVDVAINRTAIPEPFQQREFEGLTHNIGLDVQKFVWKMLGTYRINHGTTIDIGEVDNVSSQHLSIPLFGAVFATLLYMCGMLFLHTSAVIRGGKYMSSLGDKGAGKSTTAFAMIADGCQLVSDDSVAVTFDAEGRQQVLPAFNQVNLFDDTAQKFGRDPEAAEPIHPLVEKRLHQAQGVFCNQTARAMAIYMHDRNKKGNAIPYTAGEALRALTGFSYASRPGREASPARIKDAVALVNEKLTASGVSSTGLEFEA